MAKFTGTSQWLKSQDISDVTDTIVTIKNYVQQQEIGQGKDMKYMDVIYFYEVKKGLALNNTNGFALCDLLTDEMDKWVGKSIALYVDKTVRFGGKLTPAIRVRPFLPGNATHAAPQPEPFSIDAWITELNLAKAPIEAYALKRKLSNAPISDQEAMDLNEMADARMAELKGATA